ncbi:beta-1,6-N-acetylglucosaminyltransferase [Dyadobacter jiangsuensis]|uniref:Peptide O-xylosyltransferase n=1 Tax=Dyadobacter jiangsuensis TaxID=1591085 RepID=A0A2P8FIF4_9BACT|nr:beta-1,6-N-acetylglucosaminyltransferase [Dyadobacter jiangsuensis]PSL21508.1 core-2/I-Branching enzyme [Dyadobacter jiangsuensis]
MHIHYLILAHKNLNQTDRLIRALEGKETTFYVHVDKKINAGELKKTDFFRRSDVKIIKNRKNVSWGGYSIVAATLDLMRLALAERRQGYVVLLSGQDFPLRHNDSIRTRLAKDYGSEYLHFWQIPHHKWDNGGVDRFSYFWFVDQIGIERSWNLYFLQKENGLIRNYFDDFPPFGGSQWWCLTTECIAYILRFLKYNPVFSEFFETTLIPDEMFFHTIIINSEFKDCVTNDNLRYIVFEDEKDHPECLVESDFESLTGSNKLWARKFDVNLDCEVLDRLEAHIDLNR